LPVANGFIEQFIEHYTANYRDYSLLAEELGRECDQLCKQEGIKAVVTWRAKDKDRLREKIYKRAYARPNGFGSPEEIKSDIWDLCGARIALYYPADAGRVSDLVRERFKAIVGKTHPENGTASAPGGEYHGHNLRAALEHPNVGWVRVEIQVMTLLMNAWSEISHDDLYQGREGELSGEELSLLKDINLLVLEAEGKVERYQHLVQQRPRNQDRKFKSIYDLLDFLGVTFLPENAFNKWFYNTQRRDLLFWLVMEAGYDTPAKLKPLLSLHNEYGQRRALYEYIFANRPDLIMPYMLQKSPHLVEADEDRKPIEQAIENWRVLDRVLRFLAARDGNTGKLFSSIEDHIKIANLTEDESKVIRWGWKNADTIINAISRIVPYIIEGWNDGLSADMQKLASSPNSIMAAAFEWELSLSDLGENSGDGEIEEGHLTGPRAHGPA
jgi:ppGpp synthetase/RelA/SpoT-type nucleotidyltranferase